jgi:hypothetical protein
MSMDTALALHTRYQRLRIDQLTIGLHTLIDISTLRCRGAENSLLSALTLTFIETNPVV